MSNPATTIIKHLRTRTIPLSTTHTRPLSIAAAKARVKDWNPPLLLDDLKPNKPHPNNDHSIAHTRTYSAFDPCAAHPFLLSSTLPLPLKLLQTPPTPSTPHHTINAPRPSPAKLNIESRPWPYSLPRFLRPKAGTTFDLMYGGGVAREGRGRVGVMQAVLYGVPDPDGESEVGDCEGRGGVGEGGKAGC